jgi:hypothetical protein
MVAFLSIYPNGSWEEKLEIAARGKLVATMVVKQGRCGPNGPDSIVCQTLQSKMTSNGVNWTPTPPPPPAVLQMRGDQIFVQGWLFHRSQ